MQNLLSSIAQAVENSRGDIRQTSDFIHQNPELGFEEHQSRQKLVEVLQKYGFEIEANPAGMETAFLARLDSGKPGPHVAILAEYDALPELGHGCGHNLIAAAALGAALGLAPLMPELNGRLSIVGTPAEEVLLNSGKLQLIEAGFFNDVDAAIMAHPSIHTSLGDPCLANDKINITFHGKPAHAAAAPHLGVNAYDALQLTFTGINYLRQQMRQDARVHWGEVMVSGAMNVIPDKASAAIGTRSLDNEYTTELSAKVVNCIKGAALMTGCEPEYQVNRGYRALKSNSILQGLFGQALDELEVTVHGSPKSGGAGSTDMGDVSQVVPAIHPMFQVARDMPLHSQEFCQAAGSEEAFEQTLKVAQALGFTAARCLQEPDLAAQAKKEFENT